MNSKFLEGAKIIEFDNDNVQNQSAMVVEKDGKRYLITVSNDHRFVVSEQTNTHKEEIR